MDGYSSDGRLKAQKEEKGFLSQMPTLFTKTLTSTDVGVRLSFPMGVMNEIYNNPWDLEGIKDMLASLEMQRELLKAEITRLKEKRSLLYNTSLPCLPRLHHQEILGSYSETVDTNRDMPIYEFDPISNCNAAKADIIRKLEADDESKVKFSDFFGLDGERMKVGKYSIPLSLHSTVENINKVYGDFSATGKMNPSSAEPIYIIFCASIKEMSELRLDQVTKDRLLKWRDAIKDALRINFNVDFAMEHLKKIACAYIEVGFAMEHLKKIARASIGLMEGQKLGSGSLMLNNLMDAAVEFNHNPVRSGGDLDEKAMIDTLLTVMNTGGGVMDNSGKKKKDNARKKNFDDQKAMMDTLLTVMNTGGGVADNSGTTATAHVDYQGEPRRSTRVKIPSKRCIDCDGHHGSGGMMVFGTRRYKELDI